MLYIMKKLFTTKKNVFCAHLLVFTCDFSQIHCYCACTHTCIDGCT